MEEKKINEYISEAENSKRKKRLIIYIVIILCLLAVFITVIYFNMEKSKQKVADNSFLTGITDEDTLMADVYIQTEQVYGPADSDGVVILGKVDKGTLKVGDQLLIESKTKGKYKLVKVAKLSKVSGDATENILEANEKTKEIEIVVKKINMDEIAVAPIVIGGKI